MKENEQSKENVIRRFAQLESDQSLSDAVKKHKKDIVMLETFLEIRDLLQNMKK